MELWVAKALSMSLLGLVSFLCGLAPLFMRRCLTTGSRQGGIKDLVST